MLDLFRRGARLFLVHSTIYEALSLQMANEARRKITEQASQRHDRTGNW